MMPAFAIIASSFTPPCLICSIHARTDFGSESSHSIGSGAPGMPCRALATLSLLRPAASTLPPRCASTRTVSLPSPEFAPVTRKCLPLSDHLGGRAVTETARPIGLHHRKQAHRNLPDLLNAFDPLLSTPVKLQSN